MKRHTGLEPIAVIAGELLHSSDMRLELVQYVGTNLSSIPYSLNSPAARIGFGFGGFVLATVLMAPITVLILALALIFGPWEGFVYAMTGSRVSGAIAFNLGKCPGHDTLKRMSRSRPYAIVNLTFHRCQSSLTWPM